MPVPVYIICSREGLLQYLERHYFLDQGCLIALVLARPASFSQRLDNNLYYGFFLQLQSVIKWDTSFIHIVNLSWVVHQVMLFKGFFKRLEIFIHFLNAQGFHTNISGCVSSSQTKVGSSLQKTTKPSDIFPPRKTPFSLATASTINFTSSCFVANLGYFHQKGFQFFLKQKSNKC